MIRIIVASSISSVAIAVAGFFAPPGRFVPSGMPVVALITGVLYTLLIPLPLFGVSDALRRAWHLPPWSIPLVAAAICIVIGLVICFGLSRDHSASGLLYYIGGVMFLPTLLFGVPYTVAFYAKPPQRA